MASPRFNIQNSPEVKEALQESHQHNLDIEAVTEATKILADYCETFKAFPNKFDSHTDTINSCTQAINNGLRLTPEFENRVKELFKTIIKEGKEDLCKTLTKEKTSFVEDVTKLHQTELEKTKKEHSELTTDINKAVLRLRHELNDNSHRISVPVSILIIIGVVVFFLALHYGMVIVAICNHVPIERLIRLTVGVFCMIVIFTTAVVYISRWDWI